MLKVWDDNVHKKVRIIIDPIKQLLVGRICFTAY
jgi:hypothetical protein